MIINTLAMNGQPPGAIHPQKFAELSLYRHAGIDRNVIVGVITPGGNEYFTLIFPDCRLLESGIYPGVYEGVYEAVKPSGWVRPVVMLSSPLCTGTGDAFRQLLDHAGIKREELHLVERFYP
jgi:hypothetical protein